MTQSIYSVYSMVEVFNNFFDIINLLKFRKIKMKIMSNLIVFVTLIYNYLILEDGEGILPKMLFL